ncbi:hypothetical protein SUNI508_12459 [Seiridium unicorne]|uniref:Uncharacterized protein n=1 Tax=Seiridium unicorne TaxID=138068 RepID=A0ABR2UDS7_9PEZI
MPTLEQRKILEADPTSIHGTHFAPNLVAVVAIYQDVLDSSSNFKPDVTWRGIEKSVGGLIATKYTDDFCPVLPQSSTWRATNLLVLKTGCIFLKFTSRLSTATRGCSVVSMV